MGPCDDKRYLYHYCCVSVFGDKRFTEKRSAARVSFLARQSRGLPPWGTLGSVVSARLAYCGLIVFAAGVY